MRRGPFAFIAIAAGAVTLGWPVSRAQDVLKPFKPGDDDIPVRRAVPVRPPANLPANPVDDGSNAAARATPAPKATPIPVRRAKPVKGAPEPQPQAQPQQSMGPEPSDPGEIRIAPQTGTRTADQIQFEVADNYYSRKMYDMAAPEYQRYIEQYPGQPDMQAALYRLAQCQQKIGSINAARTTYEQLLDRFQTGDFIGPASYCLAQLYYQDKNYALALPLYRRATVRMKEPSFVCGANFSPRAAWNRRGRFTSWKRARFTRSSPIPKKTISSTMRADCLMPSFCTMAKIRRRR
ncbi:MAG TPA: tetratricopeptide repeat protein [Chthoniobacteraceae bacterium]